MPNDCPDFPSALQAWSTYYRRSLLVTRGQDCEIAQKPLRKSVEAWYEILGRYYEEPPDTYAEDLSWQADLATITGRLHLAEWQVIGGNLKGAHATLEPVRRIWTEIRERNGVRWFGDELARYHDVMEPVMLWGTGETHGGVTDTNIEEFEAEVAKLADAWTNVARFPFRARRPRGPGGYMQYRMFMSKAYEAVAELLRLVEERRLEEIPEAARALQTTFVPLFMQFG